jgi:hypothetical protein
MIDPAPKPLEKHALIEAADAMADHGIEIKFPWECDLDDREREMYEGLLACRAYHDEMIKER